MTLRAAPKRRNKARQAPHWHVGPLLPSLFLTIHTLMRREKYVDVCFVLNVHNARECPVSCYFDAHGRRGTGRLDMGKIASNAQAKRCRRNISTNRFIDPV